MRTKLKKEKTKPQDGGLDAKTIERIRKALRQVWHWTSYSRKLCIKRALFGTRGFSKCEGCREVVPKVYADHIEPCGTVDAGFLDRLFVSSKHLQALCKRCHDAKTRDERALIAMGIL